MLWIPGLQQHADVSFLFVKCLPTRSRSAPYTPHRRRDMPSIYLLIWRAVFNSDTSVHGIVIRNSVNRNKRRSRTWTLRRVYVKYQVLLFFESATRCCWYHTPLLYSSNSSSSSTIKNKNATCRVQFQPLNSEFRIGRTQSGRTITTVTA